MADRWRLGFGGENGEQIWHTTTSASAACTPPSEARLAALRGLPLFTLNSLAVEDSLSPCTADFKARFIMHHFTMSGKKTKHLPKPASQADCCQAFAALPMFPSAIKSCRILSVAETNDGGAAIPCIKLGVSSSVA